VLWEIAAQLIDKRPGQHPRLIGVNDADDDVHGWRPSYEESQVSRISGFKDFRI
jgi:hypothetical protein